MLETGSCPPKSSQNESKIIQNYPLILEVQEKSWSDSLMINLRGIGKHFALNALSSLAVTDSLKIPHKKIVDSFLESGAMVASFSRSIEETRQDNLLLMKGDINDHNFLESFHKTIA